MPYPLKYKERAIRLRRQGLSLKEISEKLRIAKSTASIWLSSIKLSFVAQRRLEKRKILGQYKTVLLKRERRRQEKIKGEKEALVRLEKIRFTPDIYKLICASLWWCEGNKETTLLRFTSSDSTLIQIFLSLLRKGFLVDESKFRVLMHLHSYHKEPAQKIFWSKITNIPPSQFNRSFIKPNTGKRTKDNYPGCIAISYYDAKIAKELEALYNAFTKFRPVR